MCTPRRPSMRLQAILVAVPLLIIAVSTLRAQPLFPNPVFDVGGNPGGVVRDDFNGDGISDLAVASGGLQDGAPSILSILLGQADGSFRGDRITLDSRSFRLSRADLNADGHADLLVPSFDAMRLSVFLGDGDGAFAMHASYSMPTRTFVVTAADLNNDGREDVAAVGWHYVPAVPNFEVVTYLMVSLGNGDGTLTALPPIRIGRNLTAVEAADLDGDGIADLTVVDSDQDCFPNCQARLLTFLGRGDGTFAAPWALPLDAFPTLALADMDADGTTDAVVTHGSAMPRIDVFLGQGDGTLGPSSWATIPLDYGSRIVPGDVNGDGALDLISFDLFLVTVHLGMGHGRFDSLPSFEGGTYNSDAVLGEFDGDGVIDLAMTAYPNVVFLFYGNGDGSFGPHPDPALLDAFPGSATVGDFNHDGRPDLAIPDQIAGVVRVALGTASGFGPEARYATGDAPWSAIAGDLDADGDLDLLVANLEWTDLSQPPPEGTVSVLLGDGAGSFGQQMQFPVGTMPNRIALGDLDLDGRVDMVVADRGSSPNDYDIGGDVSVLPGLGDGTFGPRRIMGAGAEPTSVAVGDLDGDGWPDIGVADRGDYSIGIPGALRVFFNRGDAVFDSSATILVAPAPADVTITDMNRDGRGDVILVDEGTASFDAGPGYVHVALGRSDATFDLVAPLEAGYMPLTSVLGDFDADGAIDVVLTHGFGYASLLRGRGDGSFLGQQRFSLFGAPTFVLGGDFNGDTMQDLAVLSSAGFFILSNEGGIGIPDISVSNSSSLGRGAGTISWRTTREVNLSGFNIVVLDGDTRVRQNNTLIPCIECITGSGSTYEFIIPKHRSARNIYIEAVLTDRRTILFGPAQRH